MPLTIAEIEAIATDLPAAFALYQKIKTAVASLPAGDTKAADWANVLAAVLPDIGAEIDTIRTQLGSPPK